MINRQQRTRGHQAAQDWQGFRQQRTSRTLGRSGRIGTDDQQAAEDHQDIIISNAGQQGTQPTPTFKPTRDDLPLHDDLAYIMGDISNLKQDNKGPSGHSNLKKDSRGQARHQAEEDQQNNKSQQMINRQQRISRT